MFPEGDADVRQRGIETGGDQVQGGARPTPSGSPFERPAVLWPAVIGCSFLITLALWIRTAHLTPTDPWWSFPADHHIYLFMATHPIGGFNVAPWCWRVLGPLIAGQFGNPSTGFQVVTFTSLWLTGAAVFALVKRSGHPLHLAATGMLLFFSFAFAVKFNMWDFWLGDPLAFLFLALGVLCIVAEWDGLFAVCVAVGVIAKESVVFVVPLFYGLRATQLWDRRTAKRALLVGVPSIAVLVFVRLAIPAWNSHPAYIASLPPPIRWNAHNLPTYSPWFILRQTLARRAAQPASWFVRTVSAFGLPALVLAACGGRRNLRLLSRAAPFLLLVLSQELFALNTERLLVLAFPVVILLALEGARRLEERGSRPWIFPALAGSSLALCLLHPTDISPSALLQLGVVLVFISVVLVGTRARGGAGIRAGTSS